jgi:hypothetical protein
MFIYMAKLKQRLSEKWDISMQLEKASMMRGRKRAQRENILVSSR